VTSTQGLPLVVIACQVFQSLIEKYLPEGMAKLVKFKDYGLHRVPAKLTCSKQEEINTVEAPA